MDARSARPVGGGCIHAAWRLDGPDGPIFLKTNRADSHWLLEAEADGLAALRAERGAPDQALELLAAALAWRRSERVPLCAVNRTRHEALVRSLHTSVEPSAWRTIEATGAARSVAEAVAHARAGMKRPPEPAPR